MKKIFLVLLTALGLGFVSLACRIPPTAPSFTPTATPTPVCGVSAPITLGSLGLSWAGYSQTNSPTNAPFSVVRNATDWTAFWGTSTPPTPPVDFSAQMLVIVVNYGICPMRTASITNVCESLGSVNVSVKDPNHNPYNTMCSGPFYGDTATAVAVNNSNLPVTWTVDTTP